jgi:peptidyl-prolyl cis-trans isomerase A (cyclophilin A)
MNLHLRKIGLITALGLSVLSCSKYADLEDGLYAVMNTSKGEMVLELHAKEAPITVANFISLSEGNSKRVSDDYANKPYYNNTVFHRVIKDFMIQGGDPTGTGQGGPGYRFKDEFNEGLTHSSKGVLSMANSGPYTNGSQFFITHKETPWLDQRHTVFGRLVKGESVLDSIANTATDPTDKPLDSILLKSVTIVRVGSEADKFNAIEIIEKYFFGIEAERESYAKFREERALTFTQTFDSDEVTTTSSGLQFTVLQAATGGKPTQGTEVGLNYAGWLSDGQLFDTNIATIAEKDQNFEQINAMHRGQFMPLMMTVEPDAPMIPGFKEAVLDMSFGEKRLVRIPSNLAYGSQGAGGVIPPDADLIFQLELIDPNTIN